MKSNIREYPAFCEALRSESLVYLFGTGISSALTGKPYSWYKWITDGINYMKNQELGENLKQTLNDGDTVDNMVYVAGLVIAETKNDNTYDEWMKEAFEDKNISNLKLIDILKKLLITQDIFATTNYDLLIEKATGLGTLSYDEPGAVFEMLEGKLSTNVIHLHGVYESEYGTDTIIASKDQYECILGNKGAQFIQSFLGTRTLIFVGCGLTSEDANISKLIDFASKHLKMDKQYFYLCRNGEIINGLPKNIQVINYGENYEDLPEFLEDIANFRLQKYLLSNSVVGHNCYIELDGANNELLQYHFSQEMIPFCGRGNELNRLGEFIECDKKFCWWAITGQAGSGKSRTTYEFLKRLSNSWVGFFLNDNAELNEVENFKPFANTLIVIDYVNGKEGVIVNAIRAFKKAFSITQFKLRVLVLERETSKETGTWYYKLLQRVSNNERVQFKQSLYDENFIVLEDLEQNIVKIFIGEVCKFNGLEDDKQRDEFLYDVYANRFEILKFRPLYVQIFVEAWIKAGLKFPSYDGFEDLLKEILQKEQTRWIETLNNDMECCQAFIKLLLFANIVGNINVDNLPNFLREDYKKINEFVVKNSFPGEQRTEYKRSLLSNICQGIVKSATIMAPLFPDIIKEYMFYYYGEEEFVKDLVRELWAKEPRKFSVFLTRCLTDFHHIEFYKTVLNIYDSRFMNTEVLFGRLSLLERNIIGEEDSPEVLISIIDNEYYFWKNLVIPEGVGEQVEVLTILKLKGLSLVAQQYGGWSLYDVSVMMEVLEELMEIKCGPVAKIVMIDLLQKHVKELASKGFEEETSLLVEKLNFMLRQEKDDELYNVALMVNMNIEMMNYILDGDLYNAVRMLNKMYKYCQKSSAESVRIFMHSCFNMTNFSWEDKNKKYFSRAMEIATKANEEFNNNLYARLWFVGCKVHKLQRLYLIEGEHKVENIETNMESLICELSEYKFGQSVENDECLSIIWGCVKSFSLNFIQNDKDKLENVITEAKEILQNNPQCVEVATTMMSAMKILYEKILKKKVEKDVVQYLFGYVEANPDSAVLRNIFFKILKDSEEAADRSKYLTKWVKWGARQDEKYNPLYGGGIDEIKEEVHLLQENLIGNIFENPYIRGNPKIGANEKCPCGSGKKFKKCCRGNGQFD